MASAPANVTINSNGLLDGGIATGKPNLTIYPLSPVALLTEGFLWTGFSIWFPNDPQVTTIWTPN